MRQKTIITKLLQSVTEDYYNVRQVLQSMTECYYKVHQVLQSVTGCYYKVRQVLQSATVTKWDVTKIRYLLGFKSIKFHYSISHFSFSKLLTWVLFLSTIFYKQHQTQIPRRNLIHRTGIRKNRNISPVNTRHELEKYPLVT